MSSGEKDGNALSRWSRRKLEARAGRPADEDGETSRAATPAQKAPEVLSEEQTLDAFRESEPELADSISKIDIDKLTFEDDFTIFMKAAVPDFIRHKALAKLWTSNPILAVLDGLNDYDLDYTQGSDVAAKVQSAAKGALGRRRGAGSKKPSLAQEPEPQEGSAAQRAGGSKSDDGPTEDGHADTGDNLDGGDSPESS